MIDSVTNRESYTEFLTKPLVLMYISALWCGPCKAIAPMVDEISNNYDGILSVGKLDVDDNPDIASELGIRSIPTILIYKNGIVVERQVGGTSKEKLKGLIEKHI